MFGKAKRKDLGFRPGAFWSRQRIAERQKADGIFWLPGLAPDYHDARDYSFDEERLRSASYNLLMGSEVYITPVSDSDPKSVRSLQMGEAFMIPPGQFAFLLTHEAVHVPNNALALLALRARSLKFQGLVNVSGFHIDPGYNGRLVLAVYNAGPTQIHLRQGQPLFEVFFADLDRSTDDYRPSSGSKQIFSIETHFITPLAGKFETLQGLKSEMEDAQSDLDSRIHAIEREQGIVRWASALLIGAAIAFGVRECSAGAAPTPQPQIEGVSHD